MQPTQEKIQVSQTDFDKMADWAKPSYSVQPTPQPQTNVATPPSSVSMTPESLQSTPLVRVPQVRADTTSAGVVAGTQPDYTLAMQNAEKAQQAVGTQAQDAQANLNQQAQVLFNQKADAQANQVNLENQAGIQEQQKALSQINSEIANEQVAMRGEMEKIRQGYGTEAQKVISQNTINDIYGRRLADLAIRQSAANQNITAIQANAERQTKLLTAPLDTKIQYLSTFAKDNVDFLTNQQQQKLSLVIDDIKTQKADIQALQNAKTQMIMEIANNGGGTNTNLIAQIQGAKDIGTVSALGAQSGFVGKLDRQLKQAQLSKIYTDMANDKLAQQLGDGTNNANLQAYANEFNQTGKIPSATDLAKAGVTVAQVTQYAKQLPKQTGAVVDRNTGVKSQNVSDTQISGIQAIYDIRNKVARMKQLDDVRVKGLSGGLISKVTGSAIESEYVALQKEVVDLLARARTGAALTADEEAFYKKQLPGRFSNIAGLGTSSSNKLKNFDKNMTGTLESKLNSSGLAIQGYSQAVVPGYGSQVIGTVLDIGGSQYRVLPDGTLTDIIQ
jgi:hypothetical protein